MRKILTLLLFLLSVALSAQAPADYYDSADGKTGTVLQVALHDIIAGHTELTYKQLWTAFQSTDKKSDGTVWDMYSDIPGDTAAYTYTFVTNQCGIYSGEGDCYNREHSFPKSWFGEATPMYTDLFHLVPTDGYVNARRSNYPFGEVGTATWTSTNGCQLGPCSVDGYAGTVFEPLDAYKGDFARIYFYMATRYYGEDSAWPGSAMVDGAQPKPWALSMLMQWHEEDPVSQKEIDRNNEIYNNWQHNRNPFIDNPNYVCLIWGSDCDVSSSDGGDFAELNFGTDTTLDVVTWNIEHFPKNSATTRSQVKDAIIAMDADVIAVQEIDTAAAFIAMVDALDDYDYVIGSGNYAMLGFIYKKDSITLNQSFTIYESNWNEFPRDPLVMDITYHNKKYIIINNHLKCCGDGTLDTSNSNDEENRRLKANNLLKTYIEDNYDDVAVITVGDFNDVLEDAAANNVFQSFINDSENFEYADMSISLGLSENWSYPSWPSHLDHVLVTDELFKRYDIQTIKLDDYIGWSSYDADLSDHRPVGIRIGSNADTTTVIEEPDTSHSSVIDMVKADYQIIVDYVNNSTELNNTHSYPANSEDHYGASAYYSNFDIRNGNYSSTFSTYDEAIEAALGEVFLPAYVEEPALYDSFTVNYATYGGSQGRDSKTFYCISLNPDEYTVDRPTEIPDVIKEMVLQFMPNPASSVIRFNADIERLQVLNLSGKTVLNLTNIKANCDLQIGNLPSGVYMLNVMQNGSQQVLKLIKK